MKKTVLSLIMGGLFLIAFGQDAKPPKEVQEAFSKKFSNVQSPKWEQEENEWEAEFKLNGTELSASFDKAGTWLETETEISKKDVPAKIIDVVNKKYEGWKLKEAEQIEKPGYKGYEIELEQGENVTEIQVSDAGVITSEKVNTKDEDNDND